MKRFLPPSISALFLLFFCAAPIHATEKITNGMFESGNLNNWSVINLPGSSTASISGTIESANALSGNHSAKLAVKGPAEASQEWRLRFEQLFQAQANRLYQARALIQADAEITFQVQVIENVSPFRNFARTYTIPANTPVVLRFSGTANWSGTTRLSFVFGSTDTNGNTVNVWIDDASVNERTTPGNTAAVTVDFNAPETAADLTGLLLGLGTWYSVPYTEPGDQFITPLNLRHWRTMQDYDYINRVLALGAKPIVLRKINWWAGSTPGNPNTPWADNYAQLDSEVDDLATRYGTQIIYEVWNEPDLPDSFANYAGGTFDKYLELFKRVHGRIRAIVPNATIIGPSLSAYVYDGFDWAKLKQFMDYCLVEGLTVQGLSLHLWDADENIERMREDLLRVREQFIDNPHYAAVGVQELYVTEYAYDEMRMRPGSNLAMVRLMEEGLVDRATSSCWTHLRECTDKSSCFDGTLSGMLTCDRSAPRPLWWAKKWYGESVNGRVAATSDNGTLVPIASNHSGVGRVLLASRGYSGPAVALSTVNVNLQNLVAAGIVPPAASEVTVYAYRAPFNDLDAAHAGMMQPEFLGAQTVAVSGGNATVVLSNVGAYDAVLLTFEELAPVDFSPLAPLGTWSGKGADDDLNNPANWGGNIVPAAGSVATWAGYQQGDLDLTFDNNVGGSGAGSGWKIELSANQTGNLSISNTNSQSRWLRFRHQGGNTAGGSLDVASGAGGLTIGASGNPMQIMLGQSGTASGANLVEWQNNSSYPVIVGPNVTINSDITSNHGVALNLRGSGDYILSNSWNRTSGGGSTATLGLSIFSSGTTTLSGTTVGFTRPGVIRVAGNGVTTFSQADNINGFAEIRLGFTPLGGSTGTLRYEGTANATLTKLVRIGEGGGQGTIENNGSGTLTFSNPNFNVATPSTGGTRTLTLSGTNSGLNTIAGVIRNPSSNDPTHLLNLVKTGSGTWVLGGANIYTGTTFVNQGSLLINGSTAAGSAVTVSAGAAIGGSGAIGGNLTLNNGANFVFDPNSTLTINGTANLGNLGVSNLLGLTPSTPAGVYPLLTSPNLNTSSLQNVGFANAQSYENRNVWFELAGNTLNVHIADTFTYTVANGNATITGYNGPGGLVRVPETLLGHPVVAVSAGAFQNNAAITRMVLPAGLAQLGDSAFAGTSNLEWILFRGDAPVLGSSVFSGSSAVVFYRKSASGWDENAGFGGLAVKRWDRAINARLGRGINFGNSFDAPSETALGNPWQPVYFEIIAAAGFDHIRLPVRWEPSDRSMNVAPYTIYPTFFARIKEVVDKALEEGVPVVLNMHHHDELFADASGQTARFVAQWQQIADFFKDYPEDQLIFELLNEPHGTVTPTVWNNLIVQGLAAVRASNPDRLVAIGTAYQGGIRGLAPLVLPPDDALLLTVHYYEPYSFTHQGASWVAHSTNWVGTEWRDSDLERAAVQSDLDQISTFAAAKDVPVYLGEFGVIEQATSASRVDYMRFLAREFETRGWSWAAWQFTSNFSLYDKVAQQWNSPLLTAILGEPLPPARVAQLNQVYTSNWTSGSDGWSHNQHAGAQATLTGGGGQLTLNITNAGTEIWHIQLRRAGINLQQGKSYRVTITGSSAQNLSASASVGENSSSFNPYSAIQMLDFPPGGKTHKLYFQMNNATDPNARINLDIGLEPGTLVLTEVRIEEYDVLSVPVIATYPTASLLTEGQSLAQATLTGGVADVAGTFAFTDPSIIPPLGTTPQNVTFTPTNTSTHTSVTFQVDVTVRTEFAAWIDNYFPGETSPAIVGADADPDGDGITNAAEKLWGTDPSDPGSRYIFNHEITTLPGGEKAFQITFPTLSGRVYTVERSTNLLSGSWTPIGAPIVGNGNAATVQDPLLDKAFYRVRVNYDN